MAKAGFDDASDRGRTPSRESRTASRESFFRLIHPHIDPRRRGSVHRKETDDDVEVAVAVDVADVERRVARESHFERVPDEYPRHRLLEPHECRQRLLI